MWKWPFRIFPDLPLRSPRALPWGTRLFCYYLMIFPIPCSWLLFFPSVEYCSPCLPVEEPVYRAHPLCRAFFSWPGVKARGSCLRHMLLRRRRGAEAEPRHSDTVQSPAGLALRCWPWFLEAACQGPLCPGRAARMNTSCKAVAGGFSFFLHKWNSSAVFQRARTGYWCRPFVKVKWHTASFQKGGFPGNSPVAQWLTSQALTAQAPGSIPGGD